MRKIEISQAELKTEVRTGFKAVNQRFDDMNRRFDALKADINARFANLTILIALLITGMFGFAGYLAYDRKKLNKTLIEIQRGVYRNRENAEQQNEKITVLVESLKKLAKNNKAVQNILHKHGL